MADGVRLAIRGRQLQLEHRPGHAWLDSLPDLLPAGGSGTGLGQLERDDHLVALPVSPVARRLRCVGGGLIWGFGLRRGLATQQR